MCGNVSKIFSLIEIFFANSLALLGLPSAMKSVISFSSFSYHGLSFNTIFLSLQAFHLGFLNLARLF